jgi:hypothetical protein
MNLAAAGAVLADRLLGEPPRRPEENALLVPALERAGATQIVEDHHVRSH